MKKLLLSLVGAVTGMVAFAQNFTVTGTIIDANSNPVANQLVYISADSTVFNYWNTVYSDASGNFTDVIPNGAQIGPNIEFYVSTNDNCNPNNWLTVTLSNQQGTVNSGVATFTTCANNQSGNCQASFYAVDSSGTGDFYFVDMSYGTGLTYAWDFGDGNTSTLQNPAHSYTSIGTYTVCLTVSNFLCTTTYCTTVTVGASNCQANFYAYNDTVNDIVYLVDLSYSNNSQAVTYSWDFGDGNTSGLQYPSHTYASNGIYLVCLTIADNNGCTSTFCDSIGIVLFTAGGDRSGFTVNVIPPAQLGVNEVDNSITGLNVYPNPANENVSIQYNAAVSGNHSISLSDMTGKMISNENFAAQKGSNLKQINLSDLAAGIYMLSIADENGTQNHIRLIKE